GKSRHIPGCDSAKRSAGRRRVISFTCGLVGRNDMTAEINGPAQEDRREFIALAAQAFVWVGSGIALWPFIDQMSPNKGTPPPEVKEVDLSSIQPGQTTTVRWRGSPI